MSNIESSQLSQQVRDFIAGEIAKARAADAAAGQPKELSPQEKVGAALAAIDSAETRERVAPGHNDHIVSAIVTWIHAFTDAEAPADVEQPAPEQLPATPDAPVVPTLGNSNPGSASNDSAPAVQVTAPAASD